MRAMPLFAVVLCTCGAFDDPPPPEAPPEPVAEAEPAPLELDPEPTGPHNGDSSLTLDRCVRTAWSYHGCDSAFPVQGRLWITRECEGAGTPPADISSALDGTQLDGRSLDRELAQVRGERVEPQTDADRYRAVVCARLAEYQMRGVGGPVDREAGLSTLRGLCDQRDRLACAKLAEALVFDGDADGARPAFRVGCEEDPRNSPAMLCANLRDAYAGGLHRWEVTLTEAEGAGLSVGDRCTAWVLRRVAPYDGPWIRDRDECDAQVRCGDTILYGDGGSVCPCNERGGHLTAGEDMVTGTDGDPAFSVDTRAGTLTLSDDAAGEHGAFTLRARLDG